MSLVHNGRRALRGLLPLQRAFSAAPAAAQQPQSDNMEVFVNEQPVSIPKGSTVLQACDAAGIDIPRCEVLAACGPAAALGSSPPDAPLTSAGSATTRGSPSPATAACAWWR
jgi:hypothetical protein